MEYESLTKLLEGWFDKPLVSLPAEQRKRVERDFPGIGMWNVLSEEQRRRAAKNWDENNDPALEEQRTIGWEAAAVGWAYWEQVPSLTAQEFAILRHARDPRKFEDEKNNIPGGEGKTLDERVRDDVRIAERDESLKNSPHRAFGEWVSWADKKGWALPSFMRHAARAKAGDTANDRQSAQLQSKAEATAKTLRAKLHRAPSKRDVAKELAATVKMKATTVERRIKKTW